MKFSFIVLFLCLSTLAQSKESSAPPAGVPAGAVSVEGHMWRWVDKAGKVWLYRSTPFGLMRTEEPRQAAAKRPAGVPVEATPVSEGVWRWIDAEQKVWLFKETSAGLMKTEEPKGQLASAKAADAGADAVLDLISVKEEGDSLRFSRPGPFGTYSWLKKKNALDRDETIVWERSKAGTSAAKKD